VLLLCCGPADMQCLSPCFTWASRPISEPLSTCLAAGGQKFRLVRLFALGAVKETLWE
jgi:hypothetical protein